MFGLETGSDLRLGLWSHLLLAGNQMRRGGVYAFYRAPSSFQLCNAFCCPLILYRSVPKTWMGEWSLLTV